jgi:hypothetical protein
MGHNVGEAAARSVRKSEKARQEERTQEQIIRDIRNNLSAKLAVTPSDTAFLLAKYDEALDIAKTLQNQIDAREASDKITRVLIAQAEASLETATVIHDASVEYHVNVPQHVGDTVRIISEVGPVNVVGDVKETNAQKSQ